MWLNYWLVIKSGLVVSDMLLAPIKERFNRPLFAEAGLSSHSPSAKKYLQVRAMESCWLCITKDFVPALLPSFSHLY